MNPKDKARELVLKFYPNVQWKLGQENCIKRAKNCALIAVEEVRNFHYKLFFASKGSLLDKYLDNVVKEIELL